MNTVQQTLLDDTAALELLDQDRELLSHIRALFVETAPELKNEFQEALKHGELGELRRLTHSLKSSSRSIGALPLATRAAETEELLSRGLFLPEKLSQLLLDLDEVLSLLENTLG